MKRCPECRRDYYDDTLLYCLDDGNALLEGPASVDEPATAILQPIAALADAPTRSQNDTTNETVILPTGTDEIVPKSRGIDKRLLAVPLLLAVIIGAGLFGYRYFEPNSQIESIAVMPFTNDTGDADVEYLSDGLTETLIKNLSQLANLRVRPRSSVFRYKGRETETQAAGRELQVEAILNGRVIRRGQDLSLFVELVEVASNRVVWSEQYSRDQSDLVSLEHEVARNVTARLKVKLSGAEEEKLLKTHTLNPEAYQLYLRGRHEWNKFSLAGLTKSIEYFERAIQADPDYALAYSGLADSYINLGVDYLSPKENMPKAMIAALKAIELDDSSAEGHTSLGSYKMFFEWDSAGAEREYRKAIALDANYANAHHFYSHCLQFSGRESDAIREMQMAVQLEPLSAVNNAELAWAYYLARQHDMSIEQSLKTIELEPGFAYAYLTIGLAYTAKGMYPEAIAALEKGINLAPDWLELQGNLAYTLAYVGDRKKANDLLSKLVKASASEYVNEVTVAAIYVALNENDKAMSWLERGYQDRCSWMKWIWIEPKLDRLRRDPRFQDLVRRIGT